MLQLYLAAVDSTEDKSLIEFLYTEYKQIMYKTAVSILHNNVDAEDAVHEAFLRVIKNISKFHKYSCNENVSYLVIIVRGIALNMLAESNNTVALSEDIPSEEDVEATTEISITYEQVVKNIESLSPALKNIATLRWVNDLSEKEISEMLDMNINTVRSSISRAKAILNKAHKEEEESCQPITTK